MPRDIFRRTDEDDDYEDDDYEDDRYDRRRRRGKRHRADMILILGILSLVACAPVGIVAWILGGNDLAEMQAGRMDRSGEDNTRVGYYLGMAGSILFAIGLILGCLWVTFILSIASQVGARGRF